MKELISPSEAFQRISDAFTDFGEEIIALPLASGRVLAENVIADRDQPPFNRVMMDGYAFTLSAWEGGIRGFDVEDIQAAGASPVTLNNESGCIEVMTGAVLPNGCSVVVQYEKSVRKGNSVQFEIEEAKHFQNIHAKAFDRTKGQVIVSAGSVVGPLEMACLASVGMVKVKVKSKLSLAIVSTGNELVEVHESPSDYEIRSSNLEMLQNLLAPFCSSISLFRLSDDEQETSHFIQHELENFQLVCFTGGVSMGKYDCVSKSLEENAVTKHFHGVKQKPGKPFFFGSKKGTKIFAFPGNPISVLHCATRFLLPHLKKSSEEFARSVSTYTNNSNLTVYLPAIISTNREGSRVVERVRQNGSGDFMGAVGANGFVEIPPNAEVQEHDVLTFFSF